MICTQAHLWLTNRGAVGVTDKSQLQQEQQMHKIVSKHVSINTPVHLQFSSPTFELERGRTDNTKKRQSASHFIHLWTSHMSIVQTRKGLFDGFMNENWPLTYSTRRYWTTCRGTVRFSIVFSRVRTTDPNTTLFRTRRELLGGLSRDSGYWTRLTPPRPNTHTAERLNPDNTRRTAGETRVHVTTSRNLKRHRHLGTLPVPA